MNHRKHYLAAVSAFAIWGFFSIPLKSLQGYSAGEILYFRILFSAVLLLAIVFGFRRQQLAKDKTLLLSFGRKQRNTLIVLTLARGILLTLNWLTFIYVINAINIKTASFAYFICPVITTVLGYFLLKEEITSLQWVAIGLCVVSCVLLGLNSALELGYSFITAITYALYLISQRKNQGFDRLIILAVQVVFALILLTCFYSFLVTAVPAAGKFYLIILMIAAVFTILPLFLNLFALNKINSTTIGVLLYINPLMNFGLAFMIYGETATHLQLTGYAIILVALVLFNYPNLKKLTSKAAQMASQSSS